MITIKTSAVASTVRVVLNTSTAWPLDMLHSEEHLGTDVPIDILTVWD